MTANKSITIKKNHKMKKILLILGLILSQFTFAQVGINNTNPKASLDVTAKTIDGSKPEGIIAPRLTGDQILAADAQYGTDQSGTILYATAPVTAASTKTAAITTAGYYYFDGSLWQKLSGGGSAAAFFSVNMIKKSGDTYTALLPSDLTNTYNTLTFVAPAPNMFTLTSLTPADTGKILIITNLAGSNFIIRFTNDEPRLEDYTVQQTRGVTFIWATNGWIRGSF